MNDDVRYPAGTVRALLPGPHVSEATRRALQDRLDTSVTRTPCFFDADTFTMLGAVCARMVPDAATTGIDVAGMIDTRIASGGSKGWRYDTMPAQGDAYTHGLRGIHEHAQLKFANHFIALSRDQQDVVLSDVQSARAHGVSWETVSAQRFFEELLAEVAECYYSHPLAQEDIGYVGMADVPAWNTLGLNALEEREPHPLPPAHD